MATALHLTSLLMTHADGSLIPFRLHLTDLSPLNQEMGVVASYFLCPEDNQWSLSNL